jgi:hypothetical protein
VKEEEKIPRPAKGSAGNGFRLQAAMLLQDNKQLYAALRVSHCLFCFSFPHMHCSQRCVRDLGDMAGLDCSVTWPRQPKEKISKIIAAVSPFFPHYPETYINYYFVSRLGSVNLTSKDLCTVGPLRNF